MYVHNIQLNVNVKNPRHRQRLWSNKTRPTSPSGAGAHQDKRNKKSDRNTEFGHEPQWGSAPRQTGWLSANRNV